MVVQLWQHSVSQNRIENTDWEEKKNEEENILYVITDAVSTGINDTLNGEHETKK